MLNERKRVAVTFDRGARKVLTKIARKNGKPISKVVADIVNAHLIRETLRI